MLTIAVSSRALFHMDDSHEVFEQQGQVAFDDYMREKEKVPLKKGAAFSLIKKLLDLNTPGAKRDRVDVVMLSRNSPDAGIRVMNSINHYGLDIECAVFAQGSDRFRFAHAIGAQLFLSANHADVALSIQNGLAAATMVSRESSEVPSDNIVRFAFDGDSVLFSDESDTIYRTHGLAHFRSSELKNAAVPMEAGPFKVFLQELSLLQAMFQEGHAPIKIALVTARGCPAHERVLGTLRNWGIRLDEAIFAGGRSKGPLLRAFGADIFFDDTMENIRSANLHDITSGHVPYGTGAGISTTPEIIESNIVPIYIPEPTSRMRPRP